MQFLKLFAVTFVYAFVVDMIWLGLIAKNIYATNLDSLLRKSGGSMAPNWQAAIVVYIMITIGILYFVLPKADGNYLQGFYWGALFGFVTYGIYDFTNFSTLANWPLKITLIDLVWGSVLCGLTGGFATFMQRWLSA
jgi:uncharacterized membrane protein